MTQFNEEWARTHIDDMTSPRPTIPENRFDQQIAQTLAANAQCPEALWQTLRSDLEKRNRRSWKLLRLAQTHRAAAMAAAASLLMILSATLTAYFVGMAYSTPSLLAERIPHPAPTPRMRSQSDAATDEEAENAPAAAQEPDNTKLEHKLIRMKQELVQLKEERDLAVTERDEIKTRIKELEKSLTLARSEADTLRSDLTLARRESTNEPDGIRQTAARLNIDLDTNVADLSKASSQNDSALYRFTPMSNVSDPNEEKTSALSLDKSN